MKRQGMIFSALPLMKYLVICILLTVCTATSMAQLYVGDYKSDVIAEVKAAGGKFVERSEHANGYYTLVYKSEDVLGYYTFAGDNECVMAVELEEYDQAYYEELCKVNDKHMDRLDYSKNIWIFNMDNGQTYYCGVDAVNGMIVTSTMRKSDYQKLMNQNQRSNAGYLNNSYLSSGLNEPSQRDCGYCNGTGNCVHCNYSGQSLACVQNPYGANCTDKYCIAKNHQCKFCSGNHKCHYCGGSGKK
jgi:hypothetical protein